MPPVYGIVRWAVRPYHRGLKKSIMDKAEELDLRPRAWSTQTAVLQLGVSESSAQGKFDELDQWLRGRTRELTREGVSFYYILTVTMRGAFKMR